MKASDGVDIKFSNPKMEVMDHNAVSLQQEQPTCEEQIIMLNIPDIFPHCKPEVFKARLCPSPGFCNHR